MRSRGSNVQGKALRDREARGGREIRRPGGHRGRRRPPDRAPARYRPRGALTVWRSEPPSDKLYRPGNVRVPRLRRARSTGCDRRLLIGPDFAKIHMRRRECAAVGQNGWDSHGRGSGHLCRRTLSAAGHLFSRVAATCGGPLGEHHLARKIPAVARRSDPACPANTDRAAKAQLWRADSAAQAENSGPPAPFRAPGAPLLRARETGLSSGSPVRARDIPSPATGSGVRPSCASRACAPAWPPPARPPRPGRPRSPR